MSSKRPVNLNLMTIRFPVPAIVSILHRGSGVVLFLFIPVLVWILELSLASAPDFSKINDFFSAPWCKLTLLFGLFALVYHTVAGLRHLLMDVGIGESLSGGKNGAWIVLVVSGILSIGVGVCLW